MLSLICENQPVFYIFIAQLDMSKSPGYLAVEELLKAQDTHMKLKRQFEEEKMREFLKKRWEVHNIM